MGNESFFFLHLILKISTSSSYTSGELQTEFGLRIFIQHFFEHFENTIIDVCVSERYVNFFLMFFDSHLFFITQLCFSDLNPKSQ